MAQLVRAPPCHGGGREFESLLGRLLVTFSEQAINNYIWDHSSAGRASALQAEGHRFEPYRFHILKENGEIAQLARAHGSYPWCRGFESPSRYYTKYESVNRVKGLQAFLCCRHIHTKIYKISFYYCHNPQNPL